MGAAPRIVLVDGSWLIFRAYFAIPANLTTSSGLHTNAIYGFATMFRKLLSGRKPEYGAVALDGPGTTHREAKYPEYKAHRPALPAELAEQLPWIDRVIEAHRFPALRVEGYEADDIIGTLVERAVAGGMDVVIVGGDKDFAQLVTPHVRMMDTLRDVTYDPDLVYKKWGVRPEQIPDLLALMGDSVDNIPGVPGIGQKGASDLLARFGSVQGVLDNVDQLAGRQKATLEQNRSVALLSRDLATIDRDAPLPVTLDDLRITPPRPASLDALYRELQFYSLLAGEDTSAEQAGRATEVRVCATPEALASALREAAAHGPTAVMPLFDPPSPVGGRLAGIAFVARPGQAFYAALCGEGATLGDAGLVPLRSFFEEPATTVITHNAKQLWVLLRGHGIDLRARVDDAMLASFLVEPTKIIPHELPQIAKEYLQRTVTPAKQITGSGQAQKPWSELPVEGVARHAAELAEAVLEVWPRLAALLDERGQAEHLREHELPLSWVLGQMELDGIRVDRDDLARMGEELSVRRSEYEQRVYELAGKRFNIGSTRQLADVLFEDLKLPVVKRTKTGYSTDSDVLERLAPRHEIARHLLSHRTVSKLINTYTDVLQRSVNPATGRIHATFQQTTGASGRLISTDPDLQRTPVRTPEGKRIRQAFVADEGCKLVSADWSQIELRVLAHFSRDPLLVASFRDEVDVHRRTAGQLFGCAPEDVTAEQRNVGKTINFATIYGQGATALGQILGIPRREAQQYIEGYFEAYAGVRLWLDETIAAAHRDGYVTTLLGRRRYIPELSSKTDADRQAGERIAANTPIQGSAADLCKLAMLQIAQRLRAGGLRAKMLLQIHDELVFEAPLDEMDATIAIVRDRMEHAHPLEVPLVVSVGVGDSWAEAH